MGPCVCCTRGVIEYLLMWSCHQLNHGGTEILLCVNKLYASAVCGYIRWNDGFDATKSLPALSEVLGKAESPILPVT